MPALALALALAPAGAAIRDTGANATIRANAAGAVQPSRTLAQDRESTMGMFSWLRPSKNEETARLSRSDRKEVAQELGQWAASRHGVEVFVEPKTAVTGTSVLLVAHDGEFTRRRIASPKAARSFAEANSLPIYDATIVGYPQRMRDYSRKQKIVLQQLERDFLDG